MKDNNIKNLTLQKLETLDLYDLIEHKIQKEKIHNTVTINNDYNFLKEFKKFCKHSKSFAKKKYQEKQLLKKKEEKVVSNIQYEIKNCILDINKIYKDKSLVKKIRENLFYDKEKDEKNNFNIETKKMMVEKNGDYLYKVEKRILSNKLLKSGIEEMNKNNLKNNKESEKIIHKSSDILEKKDKKLVNLYINKIKANYGSK